MPIVIPDSKTAGVYAIKHARTGKAYVGSTVNLRKRIQEHVRELNAGCHTNNKLQYSWNKSGAHAFELIILEENPELDLVIVEQQWINHYAKTAGIYNAAKTASRQHSKKAKIEYVTAAVNAAEGNTKKDYKYLLLSALLFIIMTSSITLLFMNNNPGVNGLVAMFSTIGLAESLRKFKNSSELEKNKQEILNNLKKERIAI